MKALQYIEKNKPAVSELPVPEISDDEVLVAARSVGVCHSDIELLEGRYIIPFQYPLIPGHEWSGEVVKVGPSVKGLKLGDRVVGECVIGDDHFGFSISGAAAEFFTAKESWLHKLPDAVDYTNGALVEPFSVAYYALMRVGNVNASDVLVVLGAGPIGLAVTAGAKALGAVTLVVEPVAHRQEAAKKLGADYVVSPDALVKTLADITGGKGANVVIEATGNPAVMAQALEIAAFKGRVGFIGIDVGREAPAKLGLIQSKELSITGSIGSPGVWPDTLRFMANKGIDLSPLVTNRFVVDEAVSAVDAAQDPANNIKAHIEFTASL
ncbi:MAG: zinc-binding dehydrogenase [Microbacteriaceae bacterium]|jgi:L-iditol 2-dehydrogenase|nr:zinc-binding dehydrogenase [Pontimonas sp.]MBT4909661.1 zinc-binding dehydrogenase [Microbacteriaceae bacterium]MBT5248187.1 zinc-binding dehydrogenase [Microbacteriaceae bacterium]MBT5616387.1 zinc-binding dehydrogenase [Microbacteriaceae bacterium]MBT5730151.1 zinc-binding dehydrogenase [Microbacteriaceae bacterium]MBT7803753.1 zinc-binding dehydrogenase [Microbacteriaceae bacterium]